MTDEHYRGQDHVPSAVGWRADLTIGVVFAVFLAAVGVLHVQAGDALRQQAERSIESDAPHRIRCATVNGATHVEPSHSRAKDLLTVDKSLHETRRHEARDATDEMNDAFDSALEIPLCDRYRRDGKHIEIES